MTARKHVVLKMTEIDMNLFMSPTSGFKDFGKSFLSAANACR
jgi:hypothetical protein